MNTIQNYFRGNHHRDSVDNTLHNESKGNNELQLRSSVHRIQNRVLTIMGHNKELIEKLNEIALKNVKRINLKPNLQFFEIMSAGVSSAINSALIGLRGIPRRFVSDPWLYEHVEIDTVSDASMTLDGGVTCAHIFHANEDKKFQHENTYKTVPPVLVIFPGLTSNQNNYMNIVISCTEKLGWTVVVVNRRGLCEQLRTPYFQVSGNDFETRQVLLHLRQNARLRRCPFVCLGHSMGGFQLARYLGRFHTDEDRKLDGIVMASTICSPTNPGDVNSVHSSSSQSLHDFLTYNLKSSYITPYRNYEAKLEQITTVQILTEPSQQDEAINEMQRQMFLRKRLDATNNAFEFVLLNLQMNLDVWNSPRYKELLTQVGGKDGMSKLIRQNDQRIWDCFPEYSAVPNLRNINIPYISVTAADDGLIKLKDFSRISLLEGKHNISVVTVNGFHCYYRESMFDAIEDSTWIEQTIFSYFQSQLQTMEQFAVKTSDDIQQKIPILVAPKMV